ncbi:MAG: SEC-C metal-binding domain-containing protein, partial [Promicromonosporaceae bacterium]|nr:SEC-C metal-binding domain-containing protein [Promicromonosporaceae bacterium]
LGKGSAFGAPTGKITPPTLATGPSEPPYNPVDEQGVPETEEQLGAESGTLAQAVDVEAFQTASALDDGDITIIDEGISPRRDDDVPPVTGPQPEEAFAAASEAVAEVQAPNFIGKGLNDRPKQVPLTYSGPGQDGQSSPAKTAGGKRASSSSLHGEAQAAHRDGETYPGTAKNAPCPCGSGKKYKLCHGKNE